MAASVSIRWRWGALAALICLVPCVPGTVVAQSSSASRPEAAKAEIIRNLMRDREFELGDVALRDVWPFPWPGSEQYSPILWCAHFLEDFRTQSGIVHVEPVASAARYDDPVFKPWQDRCPALAMNSVRMEASNDILDTELGLSPLMPNGEPRIKRTFSTRNFRLYEVDLDNNASNGNETIFYGEQFYSYWEAVTHHSDLPMSLPPSDRNWNDILAPDRVEAELTDTLAGFTEIDLQQCREASSASFLVYVLAPMDRTTRQPQPNLSGIIRYKGANYIYDLSVDFEIEPSGDKPIKYYRLELDAVLPARAGRSTPEREVQVCDFDNVGVADFAVLGMPTTHWPLSVPELPGYEFVRLALGPQRFDRLSASQQSVLMDFALRNFGWFKPLAEGGFAEPLRQAIDADLVRKEWTTTADVLRAMEPNSVRSAIAIGRFQGKAADFVYYADKGETLEQAIRMMQYAGADTLHLYLDDGNAAYSQPGLPLRFSLPDGQFWMVPDVSE